MISEKPSFVHFKERMNLSSSTQTLPKDTPVQNTTGVHTDFKGPNTIQRSSVAGHHSKTASFLEGVVSVSLVALFFGLPLFFTGLTFQGIVFEKQIYFYFWLLIGVVAWASKGIVVGEMRIRRTPLDIPLLLFWLFYVVTAFFSVDRWHSFWGSFGDPSRGVIAVTAFVLVYYFVLSHFNPKRFYWMFWSFLMSGFLVTVWSFLVVMKWTFLPEALLRIAPMSLMGSISALGIFLGFLIPIFMLGTFLLWKVDTRVSKKMRAVGVTIILLGLLLALFLLLALYSFVSWIMVIGGLSFFLVYVLSQVVRPAEQWTWVPMAVFIIVLAFLMIGQNNLVRVTLPVEVAPNINLSWKIAKDALQENFLTGTGPANYGYAFSLFRPQEYNLNSLYTLRFYQGSGMPFEMLSTIGVIGTVLFMLLWLSALSVGFFLLTSDRQRNKVASLGLWTVSVMFFLASMSVMMNGTLLALGVLLTTLALGVLLWESGTEERYIQLSFKTSPKFALALAFIFMVVSAGVAFLFVFMGKVFVADVSVGKAVRMSVNGPSLDAVNVLSRSIEIYPQEGHYYTRLGQEYMALANMEAGKPDDTRDTDAVVAYVREAINAGEISKRIMPNDVMTVELLGLLYENAGLYASDALASAEVLYKRALELEPHNPLYSLKLGQIKKSEGDKMKGADQSTRYQEAKTLFETAIAEKKDLSVAHYNLSVVLARLQEIDQAIESAKMAVFLDSQNLNYRYNAGVLYQLRAKEGDLTVAESIFKDILSVNDKLIDVRLSLGLLYEAQKKNDLAIAEYENILTNISAEGDEGTFSKTREQILQFIANVRNGTGNLKQANNVSSAEITPPVSTPAPALAPETSAVSPTNQPAPPLFPPAPSPSEPTTP
ncbi:MAG: hypothetical protein ACSLEX_01075 [Minisyncoccota bacterium]